MAYMAEVEREFRAVWDGGDVEAAVRWVKEKILQSYRNGQQAGPKAKPAGPRPPRRKEQSS